MNQLAWSQLTPREQALVAVAVLIDGAEAANILGLDAQRADLYKACALELSGYELDARLPYVGTLLRRALEAEE